jgi:hypothetical protein
MTPAAGAASAAPAPTGAAQRRRALAALAVLLALAAAGAGARLLLSDAGQPSLGPLTTHTTDSVAFGQPAGVTFAWGVPVVFNPGDEPAVLDRVTLLDATPGLRVLKVDVGGPNRKYLFSGQAYKWPDPENFTDLHPVSGMRVHPADTKPGERGVELVFVMQADEPGQYRATHIAADYHIGDTKHRTTIRSGLNVEDRPDIARHGSAAMPTRS